ncbi:MAG: amidohydrolase family protein, partial [Mycobacteriales bacterium]
ARIIDGTGAAGSDGDVAVEGGRIVDVGRGLDGDSAVDLGGGTLLPGFFDCHVHFVMDTLDRMTIAQRPFSYQFYVAEQNMRRTLDVGITSVRDAGGSDLGIAQAQRDGLIAGPRMQVALSMLSQTGGHGDDWTPSGCHLPLMLPHPGRPETVVDGPDEMRQKVRELIRDGADVIKVATSGGVLSVRDDPRHGHFRDTEIEVLVEEATAAGRFVMAHAQATDGIKVAVRAGIRSIEHGIYLDDEAIGLMLDHGTWLVPTLIAPRAVIEAVDVGVPMAQSVIEKARMVIDVHAESVRRAIAAGVKIAMGTDSGVGPHGSNLRELALMSDCGLDPLAVLHATTGSAADLLGVADDRGTIEPGKRADLVVIDGDALRFDGLGERVRAVYQDGVQVAGRSSGGTAR